MNMEIKFRAWDGKEMHTPTESQEFANIKFHAWMDTPKTVQQMKEIFIMQYTGLKDKNGKEIYEGDICKASYPGSSETPYMNKIIWNESEFGFSFANAPLYVWEAFTVIGNIYENQNLLT